MIQRYKVFGSSMEPILRNGQYVLAEKISYFFTSPKVDEVVVMRHPFSARGGSTSGGKNLLMIKRIARKLGNNYWVEGDNKNTSTDSRKFGLVSRDLILGRVVMVY